MYQLLRRILELNFKDGLGYPSRQGLGKGEE